jgi:hypothetical protein
MDNEDLATRLATLVSGNARPAFDFHQSTNQNKINAAICLLS